MNHLDIDALRLFGDYMKLVDVPRLDFEETDIPQLYGKTLGLINGSSWVQLWSYYFGRKHLPGVKLVNVGNEGVQLNFMHAHREGLPCPPESNIELFSQYAEQLISLSGADALLITCSTMNRSFKRVQDRVQSQGVPVLSIDQPMMEAAVAHGGRILVIATHGPTVKNTQLLLEETAQAFDKGGELRYVGATVEEAFHLLGEGCIREHNEMIANAIREAMKRERVDSVVLAQLSMSVFGLSYPDPVAEFGVPVFNCGDEGFKRVRKLFVG